MVVLVNDNTIRIKRLALGPWLANAYLVECVTTGNSILIDAPADASDIVKNLQGTEPRYILLTHGHLDHTGALVELRRELQVPLAIHADDLSGLPDNPEIILNDGDTLTFGKVEVQVLHTPGHTPGSLCFKIGPHLVSGDTLFPGGPGRTESPDNFRTILQSIREKLLVLPDETGIYPGHGVSTVLGKEREAIAVFLSHPHDPDLCGDVKWSP